LQGGCLYTITLTDVATGWTACLPLLNRGREAVLAALQRARALFPFPILGLDTDNGGEFINEEVAAYCVREQITFTRGRPNEKRDQCFVEQKNGVVVRKAGGSWSLDWGARLSATRRVISRFALVCQLFSTVNEAGVQTGRGEKNPSDLRRSQNAAATCAALRGLVPFSAAGTASHRESVRPPSAVPAGRTVAAGDLAL
jgi:hypothetical protein